LTERYRTNLEAYILKLMGILCNIGVDYRDIKLIWNLYKGQSAYVRVADGYSAACEIGRV